ncbi:NHL repeat-containing protein [bacterium]|nr:NHL repeat-containing protein [bacterium]
MRKLIIIIFALTLCCTFLHSKEDVTTLLIPPFKHTLGIHKGTRAKLKLLLGMHHDFDNPQGLAAVKLKSKDDPKNEKDNDEITAYGVNSGRGQIIYNKSMSALAVYGQKGSGKGEFLNPHGITANEDGDVYIADTDNKRIVKLFNPGEELHFIKSFGEDTLQKPFDLVITPNNELFVSDVAQNCVFLFDTAGKLIARIGDGILNSPRGIAVSSEKEEHGYYRENFIAVVDGSGKRIVKLNFKGKLLREISYNELALKDADFQYAALDYYDNVYVTDKLNCQVHKFDHELEYITTFGKEGDDDNEFIEPRGIAIWRRFGQIVIGEKSSAQYYWVGMDIRDVEMNYLSEENKISLKYFITERAYFTVTVYDTDDEFISTLTKKRRRKIGHHNDKLGLVDSKGKPLLPGDYKIEIKVEPTYSSYKRFDRKVTKMLTIPQREAVQE